MDFMESYRNDSTALFKQCELTRSQDGGVNRMISWIPANIAIAGVTVRLKEHVDGTMATQDEWTEGWMIENVTEPAVMEKELCRNSPEWRRLRKV